MPAKQRLEFDLTARDVNATRTMDGLADAMDRAGDSADKLSKQTSKVDAELDATRKTLLDLQREFDKTGNIDLLGKIGKTEGRLSKLEKIRKSLDEAGSEAGTSFADKFTQAAGAAISRGGTNPYLAGAIIGVGLASAPLLGAAVSGAVLGGIGTGGIVGGVALAARDPRVQAAGRELGQSLLGDAGRAAAPFLEPVLDGIEQLEGASARWASRLSGPLDSLADAVDPLLDGLTGLVDNALPGVGDAIEAGGEILKAVSPEISDVGKAVGDMLSRLADDPQGAIDGIQTLLGAVETTVMVTGHLLDGLQNVYETVIDVEEAIGIVDRPAVISLERFSGATDEATGSVRMLGDEADGAEQSIDDLSATIRGYLDLAFGIEEAQDRITQSWADLTEQIKEQREEGDKGAGSLVGNTQAALANREAIRGIADEYVDLIQQNVMAGKSTDGLRADFIKAAVQAGLNKKQVKAYADELFNIPDVIKTQLQLRFLQIGGINSGGKGGAAFSSYSTGGLAVGPGTDTSDDIVARLSNGEYVLRAAAVRAIGVDNLDRINAGASLANVASSAPSAGSGMAAGAWRGDDMEAAFVRALRTLPVFRLPDAASLADIYHRGG